MTDALWIVARVVVLGVDAYLAIGLLLWVFLVLLDVFRPPVFGRSITRRQTLWLAFKAAADVMLLWPALIPCWWRYEREQRRLRRQIRSRTRTLVKTRNYKLTQTISEIYDPSADERD